MGLVIGMKHTQMIPSWLKSSSALGLCSGLAITALLPAPPAQAGQFSVSPVRIQMAARDRATAITLTNEGDTELVMQADVYLWKQKPDGQDDLQLTEDLILSPPILKLKPKSRQVVRLARLRPAPGGEQLTYRLIVREIPEAQVTEGTVKLQIAMAFSLPIFISPPGTKRDLICTAERGAAQSIRAWCENQGNAYAQPIEFVLKATDGSKLAAKDAGGYVLPGIRRAFDLSSASAGPIPAGEAQLQVRQDTGTVQVFDVKIAE
jgi:fimbrial chaperone protein